MPHACLGSPSRQAPRPKSRREDSPGRTLEESDRLEPQPILPRSRPPATRRSWRAGDGILPLPESKQPCRPRWRYQSSPMASPLTPRLTPGLRRQSVRIPRPRERTLHTSSNLPHVLGPPFVDRTINPVGLREESPRSPERHGSIISKRITTAFPRHGIRRQPSRSEATSFVAPIK